MSELDEFIKINVLDVPEDASLDYMLKAKQHLQELQSRLDSPEKDAARYRWLREQHWSNKGMCVVAKAENVKLGSFCPSTDLLDAAIDEALQSQGATK